MFSLLPLSVRCTFQGKEIESHHDLETVERLGLSNLDLGRESLDKVFVDDTVRLSVESIKARRVKRITLTAAKKARTCSIKYRSLSLSLFSQS